MNQPSSAAVRAAEEVCFQVNDWEINTYECASIIERETGIGEIRERARREALARGLQNSEQVDGAGTICGVIGMLSNELRGSWEDRRNEREAFERELERLTEALQVISAMAKVGTHNLRLTVSEIKRVADEAIAPEALKGKEGI